MAISQSCKGKGAKFSEILLQEVRNKVVRRSNPQIRDFRQRAEWIRLNLDPFPKYGRFLHDVNDIYKALDNAVKSNTYQLGLVSDLEKDRKVPNLTKRTWNTALKDDSVSPAFIDWMCELFPDLQREHLLCETLDEFLRVGKPIQDARDHWAESIRFFSRHRKKLHAAAMAYYANSSNRNVKTHGGHPFPLLTQAGWIRSSPLLLTEDTEHAILEMPGPIRSYRPRSLRGLRGAYVNYRGTLGFPNRYQVFKEPQHNAEIFCAREVLLKDGEFVGFTYDLSMYFDYINTCEVLGAELSEWVLSNPLGNLPDKFVIRGTPESAFDLTNRAAYPGVNCITILLNYKERSKLNGHYFMLHKRDETQLQAQNTVHVVPAGGHQGFAAGAQPEDTAIWRTMVREFAEELFNREDLYKQSQTWSEFLRHDDVAKVKRLFFDGPRACAKVYMYGFGLDPITLKPEVLCAIIIDWRLVQSRSVGTKFEYSWELQTNKAGETREQFVPLSLENLVIQATQRRQSIGDQRLDALPAGAACMLLTAKHFKELELPVKGVGA